MSDEVIIKGISRLAYQFKSSSKLQEFLEAFLQQLQDLQISELQLLNERYLDTAVGVQLDGIGEIVGLPRPEKEVDIAGLFGFLDDPTALGFGDADDSEIGGNFWDGISATVLIGDDLYRLLIRAKIIENKTAMIVDDTLRLISFTFDGALVRYFQSAFLEPRYDIIKDLTPFEEGLLVDFPVLIGIDNVEYHTYTDGTFSFFGDPDPTGLGFADFASYYNLMLYPKELDNAAWIIFFSTVTPNTDIAPDNTLTADTVIDADITQRSAIFQIKPTIGAGTKYKTSVYIKKDTIDRTIRFPAINIRITGGFDQDSYMYLDTMTGEYFAEAGNIISSTILEKGDYWLMELTVLDVDPLSTNLYAILHPAMGKGIFWPWDASAIGSIVAWNLRAEQIPQEDGGGVFAKIVG